MRWLSESVEALIADELSKVHDVVVIGSGYGGAVAALRLAESGRSVFVLERGEEYLPGEFPNDIANLPSHLRLERWNAKETQGDESGLFDLRIGERAGVLVGNALGGTSQINANVAIKPDPRVFENDDWPSALKKTSLDAYYARAMDALEVTRFAGICPDENSGSVPVGKCGALESLSTELKTNKGLSVEFEFPSITVNLVGPTKDHAAGVPTRRCNGCGDCVTGCNHFAKNTLTSTYLPKAKARGARLFTGVTVLRVGRPSETGPWEMTLVRTAQRAALRRRGNGARAGQAAAPDEPLTKVLRARTVILAAGSLGSTEILRRSEKNGLSLSSCLGQRFSGNGDYLAFGYMQRDRVNGVGFGSQPHPPEYADAVGPTITGMIRIADRESGRLEDCTLVQEGSVPGAIAGIFHELTTTMASVSQLANESYKGESERNPRVDPLALQPDGLTHTQTLLAMGHDDARGTLYYDNHKDRILIDWPKSKADSLYKMHDERLRTIERLGAIYLQNPAWSPLPDSVRNTLSGPALGGGMFSVHPLGGCPMGDSPAQGVVDDVGAVYRKEGGVHRDLYVLDGSIIPRALGVNPFLTITALAERALEKIAARAPASELPELPPFPDAGARGEPYENPNGDRLALDFTEVLRGEVVYREPGSKAEEARKAMLLVHMPIADLKRFFENPSHPIPIVGSGGNDKEELAARFCLAGTPELEFAVVSGTIGIFLRQAPRGLRRFEAWTRVALTWLIERGFEEIVRKILRRDKSSGVGLLQQFCDFRKLAGHATEERTFRYELNLERSGRRFYLQGTKVFAYAASWGALFAYAGRRLLWPTPTRTLYLKRRNVWMSLGQLDIGLYDDRRRRVARGSVTMDMVDMTRRYAAQFGSKRDTASALVAFAGYPLMFLRSMIKTRLWDFRLPDYPKCVPPELDPSEPCVPVPGSDKDPNTKWPPFPPLRGNGSHGDVAPVPIPPFKVRKSRHEAGTVELKLTRYPREGKPDSSPTRDGAIQVKSIMLMNGFAQPTLPFVAQEIRPNLAEYFYDLGYDVWLFDYRTSTILDASKEACTMDDIAEYDLPAAAKLIIGVLADELGCEASKLQIYAFAHCVGAACMSMSLLGGYLEHEPNRSMIAGVIFSQMQSFLIGGKTSQMRVQVGSILKDAANIDVMRLSAAEREATAFESLLDRLFASLPVPDEERCPHENDRITDRPDIATCKRMTGTISRLLKHDRIHEETHQRLPVYFGRANTTLLVHGTKCIDSERLVNADGQNVYLTDRNIKRQFRLPIALLHGSENVLFNVESLDRTLEQLTRVNGSKFAGKYYTAIRAEGYAHFDCTIGKDAPKDIFTKLGSFLERAWKQNVEGIEREDAGDAPGKPRERWKERDWKGWGCRASAPVAGPILGWVRKVKEGCAVRVWIRVDEYTSGAPLCAMTVVRALGSDAKPTVQAWPVIRIALQASEEARKVVTAGHVAKGVGHVAIALADLVLDPGVAPQGYEIAMVALHAFRHESSPSRSPGTIIPEPVAPGDPDVPASYFGVAGAHWSLDDSDWRTRVLARLHSAPSEGFDPGSSGWIRQIQGEFAEYEAVIPDEGIPLEDADALLETLRYDIRLRRKTALSANPGTLSRRRRDLPEEDTWIAHLKPRILNGPSPAGGLRFLAGCCRYPGTEFEAVRADAAFQYINELLVRDEAHRDFIFMLGDQIYADATAGMFDPGSPIEKFRARYERAFSSREFRRLASQLPLYMVIDDHEIDNDWSRDELAEGTDALRLFRTACASFAAYQWSYSPRNPRSSGFNYQFEAGGYRFLVLDTRTQRVRGDPPVILAADQITELDRWLGEAKGDNRPKFIVTGSVLAPGLRSADPRRSDLSIDTWQMAQEQRKQVLDLLSRHSARNIVFLSGDYHCAATATLDFEGKMKAYAIVSPPFYAPYVYANVRAHEVLRSEVISLSGGRVEVTANASEGNGFSDIRIEALSGGGWSLEVGTYALNYEDETPRFMPTTRRFLLG